MLYYINIGSGIPNIRFTEILLKVGNLYREDNPLKW